MLPDWMGGSNPTKEKSPKPKPAAGAAAAAGASGVPPKVPSWTKGGGSSSSGSTGSSGSPVLDALQAAPQLNQGPQFNPLAFLQDELGMKAGALTPAAEEAQKSNPALDTLLGDLTGKEQADAGTREKLKPRGSDLKPRQMTREEYLGLPAEVRAAVDFNTMLVEARAADRAQRKAGALPKVESKVNLGTVTMPNGLPLQATPATTTERLPEGYGDVFESVFGVNPSRVSSMGLGENAIPLETEKLPPIRPEVLSVLKQIGYKSDNPDDMRAFLKLDNGISQTDIDNYLMDGDNGDKGSDSAMAGLLGAPVKSEREVFVEKIAGLTADLQEKLTKGDKMIADFQTSALKAREPDRLFLGANVQKTELPEGFGDRKVDQMFKETFEYLLQQPDRESLQNQLANFNSFLGSQGLNPDSFLDFAQTRLAQADNGAPLGAGIKLDTKDEKFTYRTPEEYRTLFGLTKEK